MPLPGPSHPAPKFLGVGEADSLLLYSQLGGHYLRNNGCKWYKLSNIVAVFYLNRLERYLRSGSS